MQNQEIINDIIENLEELTVKKNDPQVKQLIHTIGRLISRLKLNDKKKSMALAKISNDLKTAEASESQFYSLNNPGTKKILYSSGFYQSINILKEELITLLSTLKN
ncbi:MAG: hypothetical protein H0W61_11380 [Bacteroidetes bacterium]|nr:hypothetical protein [Bacteroidota bacterium]